MDLPWYYSPSDYFYALFPILDCILPILGLLFFSIIPSDFCTPFDAVCVCVCVCASTWKFIESQIIRKNSIICSLLEILTWNTEYLLTEYLYCLEDMLGALHE